MRVALANTNRMQPPIAPIGLEYVGEAMARAGHDVLLVDLCWEDAPLEALTRALGACDPGLVALSVRNSDDCYMASGRSFLGDVREVVAAARAACAAPVVLGGAGFSAAPRGFLAHCGADYGIVGDGEWALPTLAAALARGEKPRGGHDGLVTPGSPRPGPTTGDMSEIPALRWDLADVERYYPLGGQVGVETRRGCPGRCVYCADPLSKGRAARLRPPSVVAEEMADLVARGIDHFHLCDAEANLPRRHLEAVCEALIAAGLGERCRWFAYMVADGFDRQLAALCRRAGCGGINFGVDHGDAAMLARLGRTHTPEDIRRAVAACRAEGLPVMLDLLLGAPGETVASLEATISLARETAPTCVGISLGVRVYAGTELARELCVGPDWRARPGFHGAEPSEDLAMPVFYLEPALGEGAEATIAEAIGGDPRFFFGGAVSEEADYNYNDNDRLADAIRSGARGAYWLILSRMRGLA